MELKGATAGDYYRNLMERGGQLPAGLNDGDRGRAKLILEWFNAMATAEEKALLRPPRAGCAMPDPGERRRTSELLQNLVIGRLSEAFLRRCDKIPDALAKWTLPATGIQDRIGQLKKEPKQSEIGVTPVTVVTNSTAFQDWRSGESPQAKAAIAKSHAAPQPAATGKKRAAPEA